MRPTYRHTYLWSRREFAFGLYLSRGSGFLHLGPFRLGYATRLNRARRCSL